MLCDHSWVEFLWPFDLSLTHPHSVSSSSTQTRVTIALVMEPQTPEVPDSPDTVALRWLRAVHPSALQLIRSTTAHTTDSECDSLSSRESASSGSSSPVPFCAEADRDWCEDTLAAELDQIDFHHPLLHENPYEPIRSRYGNATMMNTDLEDPATSVQAASPAPVRASASLTFVFIDADVSAEGTSAVNTFTVSVYENETLQQLILRTLLTAPSSRVEPWATSRCFAVLHGMVTAVQSPYWCWHIGFAEKRQLDFDTVTSFRRLAHSDALWSLEPTGCIYVEYRSHTAVYADFHSWSDPRVVSHIGNGTHLLSLQHPHETVRSVMEQSQLTHHHLYRVLCPLRFAQTHNPATSLLLMKKLAPEDLVFQGSGGATGYFVLLDFTEEEKEAARKERGKVTDEDLCHEIPEDDDPIFHLQHQHHQQPHSLQA